jgi:hypothetical protein
MKEFIMSLIRGEKMARPRLIRTKDGGEITLRNVDMALADKIKAYVEGSEEVTEAAAVVEAAPAPTAELTDVAIGVYRDGAKGWGAAVVKFNPLTKEAKVDATMYTGKEKAFASERFRILAAESDLV